MLILLFPGRMIALDQSYGIDKTTQNKSESQAIIKNDGNCRGPSEHEFSRWSTGGLYVSNRHVPLRHRLLYSPAPFFNNAVYIISVSQALITTAERLPKIRESSEI